MMAIRLIAILAIVVLFDGVGGSTFTSILQAQPVTAASVSTQFLPLSRMSDWNVPLRPTMLTAEKSYHSIEIKEFAESPVFWPLAPGDCQVAPNLVAPSSTNYNELRTIAEDHRAFYSWDSLATLSIGILSAAPVANSRLDDQLWRDLQAPLGGSHADRWTNIAKPLGNGIYTLPGLAAVYLIGNQSPSQEGKLLAEWGERSLRTFLVGAPPLLIGQIVLGGSRPGETSHHSSWRPFADDNGMSGHSFMGSLPLINAAKMSQDRRYKVLFYSASAIVPLSRIADDAHYPTQAFLGWWVAYVAASAVDKNNDQFRFVQLHPIAPNGDSGFSIDISY